MTVTRRDLLKMAGAAGVMGMAPPSCARRSWKRPRFRSPSAAKPLIYYLPLSIAEARGYFRTKGWT